MNRVLTDLSQQITESGWQGYSEILKTRNIVAPSQEAVDFLIQNERKIPAGIPELTLLSEIYNFNVVLLSTKEPVTAVQVPTCLPVRDSEQFIIVHDDKHLIQNEKKIPVTSSLRLVGYHVANVPTQYLFKKDDEHFKNVYKVWEKTCKDQQQKIRGEERETIRTRLGPMREDERETISTRLAPMREGEREELEVSEEPTSAIEAPSAIEPVIEPPKVLLPTPMPVFKQVEPTVVPEVPEEVAEVPEAELQEVIPEAVQVPEELPTPVIPGLPTPNAPILPIQAPVQAQIPVLTDAEKKQLARDFVRAKKMDHKNCKEGVAKGGVKVEDLREFLESIGIPIRNARGAYRLKVELCGELRKLMIGK
jgi:hypothetical protein